MVAMSKKDPKVVKGFLGNKSLITIKLMSRVVMECKEVILFKEFVYPLVEYLNTLFDLHPSTKYLPLLLHVLQLKTDIMNQTGIYIPILY